MPSALSRCRRFVPWILVALVVLPGVAAPADARAQVCTDVDQTGCEPVSGNSGSSSTGEDGNDTSGGAVGEGQVAPGDVVAPDVSGSGSTGASSGSGNPGGVAIPGVGSPGTGASSGGAVVGGGSTGTDATGGVPGGTDGGYVPPSSEAPATGDYTAPAEVAYVQPPAESTDGDDDPATDAVDPFVDASFGVFVPANDDASTAAAGAGAVVGGTAATRSTAAGLVAAADEPPSGAVAATVLSVLDGDTIRVRITEADHADQGKRRTVNLLGVNAPEMLAPNRPVDCFGREAGEWLTTLLPEEGTVWLAQDVTDRDGRGRLPRYVWFGGEEEDGYFLANELLLREGYAKVAAPEPDTELADLLTDAATAAEEAAAGIWSACADGAAGDSSAPAAAAPVGASPASASAPEPAPAEDAAPAPEPPAPPTADEIAAAAAIEGPVANCMAFATYGEAQAYYADNPDDQPNIDPDVDGLACEVRFFGGDPPS